MLRVDHSTSGNNGVGSPKRFSGDVTSRTRHFYKTLSNSRTIFYYLNIPYPIIFYFLFCSPKFLFYFYLIPFYGAGKDQIRLVKMININY